VSSNLIQFISKIVYWRPATRSCHSSTNFNKIWCRKSQWSRIKICRCVL